VRLNACCGQFMYVTNHIREFEFGPSEKSSKDFSRWHDIVRCSFHKEDSGFCVECGLEERFGEGLLY
jgi:hypothetical protein